MIFLVFPNHMTTAMTSLQLALFWILPQVNNVAAYTINFTLHQTQWVARLFIYHQHPMLPIANLMASVNNWCPLSILHVKLMESNEIFAETRKLFIKNESTIISILGCKYNMLCLPSLLACLGCMQPAGNQEPQKYFIHLKLCLFTFLFLFQH